MATANYINNRREYARPQAMLWADSEPATATTTAGRTIYVPNGLEVGSSTTGSTTTLSTANNFLILSDHNRSPIDFKTNRIEKRERMINGRMRSYHIADKLTISTSWSMLPSRSFANDPLFNNTSSGVPGVPGLVPLTNRTTGDKYTVDGGAGGNELLDWYENNTGSFWVYLAYDKHNNFTSDEYNQLPEYNQAVEMFISSFDYSVQKRGGSNFDLWNISVSLEEV
jgi:hypothetical protein